MKLTTFVVFLMVSIHLESQQIISLHQAAVPNNKPYPMKEITDEENGNLMYVRNISKLALTIYFTDAEMILGAFQIVVLCKSVEKRKTLGSKGF